MRTTVSLMVAVLCAAHNADVHAAEPESVPIMASAQEREESQSGSEAGSRRRIVVNGIEIGFRWCPPGTFTMGSPAAEKGREKDEIPRSVEHGGGFWLMETEVTQELYETITCRNNSRNKGDKFPMQCVTWYGVVEFANTLSEIAALRPAYSINRDAKDPTNLNDDKADPLKWTVSMVPDSNGFRIPTEAQWEYACRAGTETAYGFGEAIDSGKANYNGEITLNTGEKQGAYLRRPASVGSYKPNPWGLHDMPGNLYEWCWDWYAPYPPEAVKNPTGAESGKDRVIRGGFWRSGPDHLRSANRDKAAPSLVYDPIGFRLLAPSLPEKGMSFDIETPKAITRKLSRGTYATLEAREDALYKAVRASLEYERMDGKATMHYWIANMLFEKGEKERALSIVRSGISAARKFVEGRVKSNHPLPAYNGFIYWGLLNTYVQWHKEFDQQTLDDYRYVFTHVKNYKGTTANLSLIHTLALYLADHIWGPENLRKDGYFGARGPKAIPWFMERIKYTAGSGSPEFASRPYMLFNIGPILSLDNVLTDKALGEKARMAYEMSLAHAAGTWLRGHWATPAGRSYPDALSQRPSGSAEMLWFYFGGFTPELDSKCHAIFAMAEKFRPSPLIINAATDRSKPYVHRSRFDGKQVFQTSFVNKTYALFSTATLPGIPVWGQCYPYGVMFDQPDPKLSSFLWICVPCVDDDPISSYTHGVETRMGQFLQHEGSFLLVAKDLKNPAKGFKDRFDTTGKMITKAFRVGARYILSHIPGGYHAMIDESKENGRVFLSYGSVLLAITSTEKFEWDPKAKKYAGAAFPGDSEFRIFGDNPCAAIETARPDEYPGKTPEEKLQAFRKDIMAKSKVTCMFKPNPSGRTEIPKDAKGVDRSVGGFGVVTGSYTDRFGNVLEKVFDGDARINGKVIDYEAWPLVDNPWVHQERDGNMTVTDGRLSGRTILPTGR